MQEEKRVDHIIAVSITDIEETPFGPARYFRVLKVRTLLGDEFVLRLRSESRLALHIDPDPKPATWPEGPPTPKSGDARGADTA